MHFNENVPHFSDFYQLISKLTAVRYGINKKILMISSATEGEGKTTVASYTAITAALSSQDYYILIDGDLRKSMLHKQFQVKREGGLVDILADEMDLADAIKQTPYANLHLVTAGTYVKNPFKLLSMLKMKELLIRMRKHYKMIFIDGPPIIPISDTLRLAQLVDGVLLVIKAGRTPRTVLKRAVDLLNETKCPLLGVVLNDTHEVLPYYYHHKYYNYQYEETNKTK